MRRDDGDAHKKVEFWLHIEFYVSECWSISFYPVEAKLRPHAESQSAANSARRFSVTRSLFFEVSRDFSVFLTKYFPFRKDAIPPK